MKQIKYKNKWQRALSTIQQKEREAGSSRETSPNRGKNIDASDHEQDSPGKKGSSGNTSREELKHTVVVTNSSNGNEIAEGKEQSGNKLVPPAKPTGTGSTSPQPQSDETKQDLDLA